MKYYRCTEILCNKKFKDDSYIFVVLFHVESPP